MISKEHLEKTYDLIPLDEVEFKLDETKTTGYDLQVEDNYTFFTSDGIAVDDCMAIYIPITIQSEKDIREKLFIDKNLINPADLSASLEANQDIILGIWWATNNKGKDGQLSTSQQLFNNCFPDGRTITETINKKGLKRLVYELIEDYDPQIIMNTLDAVKELGFKYSTEVGFTLSIDELYDKDLQTIANQLKGDKEADMDLIYSDQVADLIHKTDYSIFIKSGARGDLDQVKQLVFSRGYVADSSGSVRNKLIKNNLVTGLTPEEFFDSSWGSRKGLIDTALSTAKSGYLGRQLVYAGSSSTLDVKHDCGTKEYLKLKILSLKHAQSLKLRYFLNDQNKLELIKHQLKELVGKTIKLRSPIYCMNKKFCKYCYGDLYKILHSDAAGIIAATSLQEISTQLVLRTFHLSLQKSTKILDVNGQTYPISEVYDIIKSGKSFYTFSCSSSGQIEVSKVIDAHKDRWENKMIRVTLDTEKIVESTIDHKYIMRNGLNKRADELQVGNLLMPVCISDGVQYKIVKIETIILDEKEEFYDLTVDSDYHNFALGSGIFIHNSGVASKIDKTKQALTGVENTDIISDLSSLSKIYHNPRSLGDLITCVEDHVMQQFKIFSDNKNLLSVHYEVITAAMMWVDDDLWRLCKNRKQKTFKWLSILQVPGKHSWLLGVAFQHIKDRLLQGLVSTKAQEENLLTNFLTLKGK